MSAPAGENCGRSATIFGKRRNPGTPARATSTTSTVAKRESTAESDVNGRVVAHGYLLEAAVR